MALRLSGRLSIAQAMPSWMRTLTNSYLYSAIVLSFFSSIRAQHVPRERHLQDLDRAFGDHHAALVAPEFLDRQVGRQPHAAVDLQAAVGGAERLGVAEDLRHVGLGPDVAALVVFPRGVVDHQAQLVQLHEAVDQHPLHGLAVGERRSEGDALLGVARAELEAALDHADRPRAVAQAADIEPVLGVAKTVALGADAVRD